MLTKENNRQGVEAEPDLIPPLFVEILKFLSRSFESTQPIMKSLGGGYDMPTGGGRGKERRLPLPSKYRITSPYLKYCPSR